MNKFHLIHQLSYPEGRLVHCFLFEASSTFLEWVVRTEACIPSALHYLDNFLFIGFPGSRVCRIWPLALDKTEGLARVVKFFRDID